MSYAYAAVSAEANRLLSGRERVTDYTRRRLVTIKLMKTDEDPLLTAVMFLDCSLQTGIRFVKAVCEKGTGAAYHGNRHRWKPEHKAAREIIEDWMKRRCRHFSSVAFCEGLKRHNIPAPSPRTVRRWLRNDFGVKRRRYHHRRVRRHKLRWWGHPAPEDRCQTSTSH